MISSTDPAGCNNALILFLAELEDIVGSHSIKVADYAVMTGRELELPENNITSLYASALLHDIGKLFIPRGILYKAGNLNEGELEIIRRHPLDGAVILRQIKGYQQYADIVLYHHEFITDVAILKASPDRRCPFCQGS